MIKSPILSPIYHVHPIKNTGIIFIDETQKGILLQGNLYVSLIKLLHNNGQRYSSKSIIELLSKKFSYLDILYAFSELEEKGFIIEKSEENLDEISFLSFLGKKKTKTLKVKVFDVSNLKLVSHLSKVIKSTSEIILAKENDPADLNLVITNDYLNPELDKLHQELSLLKTPWILIKPVGTEIWLGPIFSKDKECCYLCLKKRLELNHSILLYLRKTESNTELTLLKSKTPQSLNMAFQLLTIELQKYLRGDLSLENQVFSFNFLSRESKLNNVIFDPNCSCSKSRIKNTVVDYSKFYKKNTIPENINNSTGYRTISPEKTFDQYKHLINPIGGIVSSIKDQSKSHIYIYAGGLNWAFGGGDIIALKEHFRSFSGGKGLTKNQAKTSALCETLERYSGVYQGNEPSILDSYLNLKDRAIHPNSCMLFSNDQYKNRKIWTQKGRFCRTPIVFDKSAKIKWSPVWSLTENRPKYLPTQYLYYSIHKPKESFFYADSNGCASGNTLEEAILQGFFELVERDAIAMWWYNRLRMPSVDLKSFNHQPLQNLIETYEKMGREVWALDLTHDFPIYTFVVLSREKGEKEKICFGFGAHFDPLIAITRAITEMGQFFVGINYKSTDFSDFQKKDEFFEWIHKVTVKNNPYLFPNDSKPKQFNNYTHSNSINLLERVLFCQKLCEEKGMEFLFLNQTRPETKLPVVKVIVPGLRHFWIRFAPGRLYDIPVKLGHLKKQTKETDLNPIPMFL